jgi:tight adherence protein B
MRERVRMRRKVLALTAEGRFSAAALFLIPFVTFGMFNLVAPSYYGEVWTMPATQWALGIGSGWMALGGVVMYKMVNFKF